MLVTFLYYLALYTVFALSLLLIGFMVAVLTTDKGRRSFVLAVRSLWLHKLRAFLSILGIIIATAAVIILMGFGEGTKQEALEAIKRQGATNIIVSSVKLPNDSAKGQRTRVAIYGIKDIDYDRFLTNPTIIRSIPMRIFNQEIYYYDEVFNGRLVGTLPGYAEVTKLRMKEGRFFTQEESRTMQNVIVLGSNVARRLFAKKILPNYSPIGETVNLGYHQDKYVVIGVVEDRVPLSGSGGQSEEFNNDVYVPLSTCVRWYGKRIVQRQPGAFSLEEVDLHQVILTVSNTDQVRPTGEAIRNLLEETHPRKDWEVLVPLDKLQAAEEENNRFILLLVVIGGISLLVGGIGIMNIMLATVTERTREIGIRRALGAKRKDITLQFLVEAAVQTGLGGLIGVALGLAILFIVPVIIGWFNGHMAAQVQRYSIFISLAVSVAVGIGFGWYPARRAALLDPIEALRHE